MIDRAMPTSGEEWLARDPAGMDRIERLERPVLLVLPYAMLAVSLGLTTSTAATRPALPLAALLSLVTAAWMAAMFTLRPAWRLRPGIMTVFLVVLLALAATLVLIDPWFGFFSFTGYFYAFWAPFGWWRAILVVVVAAITGTSQAGGLPRHGGSVPAWIAIMLVNVAVGSGFFWFGAVSDAQSQRRKQLVAELSEANQKLAEAARENAGLQAQLVTQAREAGIADERQRVAREIHDTIAQGLTGIITQLQAADRAEQAGQNAERRRHLAAATELARDSLTEARRSMLALRPETLPPGGLADALSAAAARWSRLHPADVQVTVTGTARALRPEAELALLRVAQEALANVAKHVRASRVGLTLSYMADQVTLDVRDDGTGLPPGRAPDDRTGGARLGGGFGLTAMRERVEGAGGSLHIESEPGGGTAISASVPLVSVAAVSGGTS